MIQLLKFTVIVKQNANFIAVQKENNDLMKLLRALCYNMSSSSFACLFVCLCGQNSIEYYMYRNRLEEC